MQNTIVQIVKDRAMRTREDAMMIRGSISVGERKLEGSRSDLRNVMMRLEDYVDFLVEHDPTGNENWHEFFGIAQK